MKQKKKKGFGKKLGITIVCGLFCGMLAAGGLAGYSYIRYQKEQKAEETKQKEEEKRLEGEALASPESRMRPKTTGYLPCWMYLRFGIIPYRLWLPLTQSR